MNDEVEEERAGLMLAFAALMKAQLAAAQPDHASLPLVLDAFRTLLVAKFGHESVNDALFQVTTQALVASDGSKVTADLFRRGAALIEAAGPKN